MGVGWFLCLLGNMGRWAFAIWIFLPVARSVASITDQLSGIPGADRAGVRLAIEYAIGRLEKWGLVSAVTEGEETTYVRQEWVFRDEAHNILRQLVTRLVNEGRGFVPVRGLVTGLGGEEVGECLRVVRSVLEDLLRRETLPFGLSLEVRRDTFERITSARLTQIY